MEKTTSEREIKSLSDKEFKASVIRMLKKQTHRHREQTSRKEEGGSDEMGIGN